MPCSHKSVHTFIITGEEKVFLEQGIVFSWCSSFVMQCQQSCKSENDDLYSAVSSVDSPKHLPRQAPWFPVPFCADILMQNGC